MRVVLLVLVGCLACGCGRWGYDPFGADGDPNAPDADPNAPDADPDVPDAAALPADADLSQGDNALPVACVLGGGITVGSGSQSSNGGSLGDECAMRNPCGNDASPAQVHPLTLNSPGPAEITFTESGGPDLELVVAIYGGTEGDLGPALACGPSPLMLPSPGNQSYLAVVKSNQTPAPAAGASIQLAARLP